MQNISKTKSRKFSPSFALISVLALVSLAALTATAFLASARLERQATSSIGNATRLEMALNSGKVCASQVINDNSQPDVGGNTHIVTYWRGNNVNDWTNELGYPFIGQIRTNGGRDNARWHYFPLFSPAGVTNLDTNVIQTAMRLTNTHQGTFSNDMQAYMSSTNGTNGFVASPGLNHPRCVQIPLLGGRTSPPVGWVYLNQEKRRLGSNLTNTSPAVRIAWFTEDLEGLIDAERMGGLTTRPSGTNSEEISLSSATGTNGALLSSVANFTNNRKSYISYGLLSSASNGWSDVTNARYFASGLRSWMNTNAAGATPNGAVAWIPVGIPISGSSTAPKGYTNQGYTKLNLNNLVSGTPAASVANIAAVITNNLPSFTNRAGGMAGGTYVSNIAANIVDLFDNDNFATTVGQSVRGVDSYPFVNEIWDRVEFKNIDVNTSVPTNWVVKYDLEITTWMELWNMSSQPVTNGSMRIFYRNREVLTNRTSGATDIPSSFTNSLNYTTNVTLNFTTNFLPTNPSLSDLTNSRISPNSYHMVSFPTFTNSVSINLTNIPTGTVSTKTNLVLLWATNGNLNGYATYFSSNSAALPSSMLTSTSRVDSSSSAFNGIQRNTNNPTKHFLDSSQTVWWRGNATPNSDLSLGLTGDPRIMFHLSPTAGQTWWDHQFESARASWWARNTMGAGADKYTVNLNSWPEYGHNSSSYPNTTDPSKDPLTITMPSQETNKPVQIIYNTPPTNIVQLGQTFDPMQWSYNVNINSNGLPLTGATAASSSGGGHTLRIGRAEHPRFAFTNMYGNSVPPIPNMSMSAAALLDLFATTNGTSVGDGPHSLGGGKINLNTAPAPVLRALAGGIRLTQDPSLTGVGGSGTNFPVPASMTEAFAQGVMRFRSKYPFLTPSHLCFIGTDPGWPNTNNWPVNAVFGTTNTIALTNAPGNTFGASARINVTAWNDQAAEEWFSKIYALSSCQSHNYRIYVVAQLVATNSSGQTNAIGPLVKKYYQIYARNGPNVDPLPDVTTYPNNTISSWKPTVGTIDIFKSSY